MLEEHARTSASARWAVATALRDQDAHVRLAAAGMASREDGTGTLLDLAGDPTVDGDVRAAALQKLASDRPDARAVAAFAAALQSPIQELRLASVRAVGASRTSSLAGRVLHLADRLGTAPFSNVDDALAAAAAEALGQLGDARAEPALLRLLSRSSARVQAAAALGRVGTIRAVEPLLPLSKAWTAVELGEVARDAIRSIQGRLGDVEGGGLSVVDAPEAGGVSLVAPGGGLSVANAKKE
jgi:HEAT repeat protein